MTATRALSGEAPGLREGREIEAKAAESTQERRTLTIHMTKRRPSLKSLKTFVLLVKNRNFTQTGKELNVTYSAVSQQIRKLEVDFNISLIEKQNGSVELTKEGHELFEKIYIHFKGMDDIINDYVFSRKTNLVQITMTPSFASEWMAKRFYKLKIHCTNMDIAILPEFKLLNLYEENIDIAIRYGHGQWAGLNSLKWIITPRVMIGSAALIDKYPNFRINDIPSIPWLQEIGTSEIEDWLFRMGIKFDKRPVSSFLPGHMVLPAMREGCGLACTAEMLVQEDLDRNNARIVCRDNRDGNSDGYYIVTPQKTPPSHVQHVIDWFANQKK